MSSTSPALQEKKKMAFDAFFLTMLHAFHGFSLLRQTFCCHQCAASGLAFAFHPSFSAITFLEFFSFAGTVHYKDLCQLLSGTLTHFTTGLPCAQHIHPHSSLLFVTYAHFLLWHVLFFFVFFSHVSPSSRLVKLLALSN